ncbi:hypothetical protein N0V84_011436 [Fusarium piperis]|uniref:Uncharacterized protein n=1 Tax=Fusarium piperis TaxID=1435070 RepID=A0A9W8TDW8_9HYPO|nr:hypothetical protein N0V84_011436 [Fusarium piperis]
MDSKQDYTGESSGEKATAKGQDSDREAVRCPQWDDSTTWLRPKSPIHGNGAGRVRKWEEYEDGDQERARLAWALKNWPTRDIPFPSIETPDEVEMPEDSPPKRQKSMTVDRFEILWHYLENSTPDMCSPTLFPSLSPVSDFDDSPPSVDTDTSLDSSSLTETAVLANDGEMAYCGEETESDAAR